jgi:hypothetical protein
MAGSNREVASEYDLFFTKDRQFVAQLDAVTEPSSVKVILTIIRQQRMAELARQPHTRKEPWS